MEGGANIYPIVAKVEKKKRKKNTVPAANPVLFFPRRRKQTLPFITAFIYLCGHVCPVSGLVAVAEGIPSTDGPHETAQIAR